ncbi:hypothetical protein [Pedobacter arcticus]|uniref:hypothetical protein n=1 Tax=Pedobacter arcticus TaxID=752140 RepID=UPI0002FE73CD|nr:hypothetical protein [Pedobacter arcticus]
MKKRLLLSFLLVTAMHSAFAQKAFTSGSLSVLRVGDGTKELGTAATPVFIDEYSTAGKLIQSIALPTKASRDHKVLTLDGNTSGISSYEGILSLSQDGEKLTVTGYNAPVGTDAVTSTESDEVKRVVGVINGLGQVNTKTALNIFPKTFISSAVVDGDNLWISGGKPNIYHTTIGATNATSIVSRTGRGLGIFDNQLYTAQSTGTASSVIAVGKGLPTTQGQEVAPLPGMTINGTTPSGRDFVFVDVNPKIKGFDVLYVANSGISDGITKYSLLNGEWVSNGTIKGQYTGITAVISGSEVFIYGIKFGLSSSELFKITDNTGYNGSISELSRLILTKTEKNTIFRGLSLSPQGKANINN